MNATPRKRRPADDPDFDIREIEEAEYSTAADEAAPEVDPRTVNLTSWDDPPGSSGTSAPKTHLDDEIPPGEQLVEEGVDEADRDQRLAASDPDYEP
jgi:hypothetical protein